MVMPTTSTADRVMEALQNDPRTKGAIIDVAASGGIVTLSGKVKSQQVREAAEEIARGQSDVLSVVNELKVG